MSATLRLLAASALLVLLAGAARGQGLADLAAKSKDSGEKKKSRVVITNQSARQQKNAMTVQLPDGDRKDNPAVPSTPRGNGSKKDSTGASSRSARKADRPSGSPSSQAPVAGSPGSRVKPSSTQPAEVRPSSSQAARETPSDRASRKYAITGSSQGRRAP